VWSPREVRSEDIRGLQSRVKSLSPNPSPTAPLPASGARGERFGIGSNAGPLCRGPRWRGAMLASEGLEAYTFSRQWCGNRVMKTCLPVTLVAGLVLGCFPHAFCHCGCAQERSHHAPTAVHPCCRGHADPSPAKPEPCRCRMCEVVKAVPAGPQTSAPSSDLTWRVLPTAVAPSVWSAAAEVPQDFSPADRFARYAHLGCALTVLLGRLLL
jgi:hypothetical protein